MVSALTSLGDMLSRASDYTTRREAEEFCSYAGTMWRDASLLGISELQNGVIRVQQTMCEASAPALCSLQAQLHLPCCVAHRGKYLLRGTDAFGFLRYGRTAL